MCTVTKTTLILLRTRGTWTSKAQKKSAFIALTLCDVSENIRRDHHLVARGTYSMAMGNFVVSKNLFYDPGGHGHG